MHISYNTETTFVHHLKDSPHPQNRQDKLYAKN